MTSHDGNLQCESLQPFFSSDSQQSTGKLCGAHQILYESERVHRYRNMCMFHRTILGNQISPINEYQTSELAL